MAIEYRVCWSASSNISFHGESDWLRYEHDENANADTVQDEVTNKSIDGETGWTVPEGLEMALEASGFDWYVETREGNA